MSDNPQAFPHLEPRNPSFSYCENGMTLRDWFAGQALGGLAAASGRVSRKAGETQAQADARWSYERADAMLAARKEQP